MLLTIHRILWKIKCLLSSFSATLSKWTSVKRGTGDGVTGDGGTGDEGTGDGAGLLWLTIGTRGWVL